MKNLVFVALITFTILAGCVQQNQLAAQEPAQTAEPRVRQNLEPTPEPDHGVNEKGPSPSTELAPEPIDSQTAVKEINVTAKGFGFSPDPIVVGLGERVKLNTTSTDVDHGFSLPDFGIDKTVPAGQTVTVEFKADKKGSFTFSCSVFCGEGHSTMKGVLIVE